MASSASSMEERAKEEPAKELVHKTKVVQFLGRTTPIILQNDNGPCPLLAICNVLLLRNQLNLSPDIAEVSQEKLLSLVAERLIDSNSNVNNKDAGYVENQQQNIADAIDLLPRLTTGIDVNIKFRRIDDFEFTRECAIFDLMDIPLYHGWIVDPQDYDTVNAIGSKSYNSLMGELVSLETRNMEAEHKKNSEEDCVDFAAATTATLGVPSPCLSRGRSFDESPRSVSDQYTPRIVDIEEDAELSRALKLSENVMPTTVDDLLAVNTNEPNLFVRYENGPALNLDEENLFASSSRTECLLKSGNAVLAQSLGVDNRNQKPAYQEPSLADNDNTFSSNANANPIASEMVPGEAACLSSKSDHRIPMDQLNSEESDQHVTEKDVGKSQLLAKSENPLDNSIGSDPSFAYETCMHTSGGNGHVQDQTTCLPDVHDRENNECGSLSLDFSKSSTPSSDSDLSSGRRPDIDANEALTSSVDGSEPIYEGEECILESGTAIYEDREPIYEGEMVLAELADKGSQDVYDENSHDEITPKQGEIISNFLKNSASQLTVYGLFCLQDGLKERELCVFFRNNHFNTMFKFEGDLYILATDQGYLNQPDLVWEKLNEVNGDTVYMTGNFKEFKVEELSNNTWDEQNAMASTADYLARIDNSAQVHSSFNSDLQLAIALQQQEFEQQPQSQPPPQPQRNLQQPTGIGGSRLVTGPQVSRSGGKSTSSALKQDAKSSKDKCIVM